MKTILDEVREEKRAFYKRFAQWPNHLVCPKDRLHEMRIALDTMVMYGEIRDYNDPKNEGLPVELMGMKVRFSSANKCIACHA